VVAKFAALPLVVPEAIIALRKLRPFLTDGSLDEQPQLGIASTCRSFFAHRKSFYRGFLIAVPVFLLAVEFFVW
jgi:hypothetical protein